MQEIKLFAVVGAGTMGSGIAQVAARRGFDVVLCDVREEFLERAKNSISSSLQRDIDKDRLTPEAKDEVMSRIRTVIDLNELRNADFVVEAVTENLQIKRELFSNLDSMLRPDVILATNTSSISITKLAAATARPDRVIGMHFMNPVPVMKLVEIIRGLATSDETFDFVKKLSENLGKIPIEVKDAPGFVSNRVLMPMINEAIFALYEGVGTVEAIDEIMKLGMRHPMGPLQLADFIGLDVCLAIMNVLYEGFNDPKYRPCPLLKKYVDAGWLGCKSGKGFYNY
ncbi:MAG: 3-hydroxybutyryl-CoA dehydrogenase [Acidobacteriota bacterium]|nr:3-hydroxybutyryl-CoA dehydrogenase [Blastocatellia bacterium]MDW8411689.1 3-hydroxybutyryl-CoA dehydrogenase [Acidobacteriota bacterium]